MIHRISTIAMFAALLLLAQSRAVDACSCITPGPACQTFWTTDAVFDATVDSVEPITGGGNIVGGRSFPLTQTLVKMTVRQAWKGGQTGGVELVENPGGGSCGYDFKVGRRYLVFASKRPSDGRLTASICSLTQEFNGTGEAADFLVSLASPPRGGRVYGSLTLREPVFDTEHRSRTRPIEARVRLSNGRATTSTNGRFEFADVAPGQYRVELELPDGYTTYQPARDVRIPNAYACAREEYHLSPSARITGRVVAHDGRPVARLAIEATPPTAQAHPMYGLAVISGQTDADGYFEIRGVPDGRYIVGVNLKDLPNQNNPYARTLYPSEGPDAHEVTVSLGQTVDLGTWRLPPPLAIVKVAGIITWQDGTPAAGIFVGTWDRTRDPIERARGAGGATSGADGRFSIELRQGRVYTFTARDRNSSLPISAPRIETTVAVEPIRIVIRQDPPR